jgi:alkaline phosphatase D
MKRTLLHFILILFVSKIVAQTPKIISGPMNGYAEHRECLIWVQTKCTKKIKIKYAVENEEKIKSEWVKNIKNGDKCEAVITKCIIDNLLPGKTYKYSIELDDKEIKFDYPLKFITRDLWEWRTSAPNFSFIAGSCNYINDSIFDRPGEPYGQGTTIFQKMAENPAKTMIWLGDNVYLREADYSSEFGIKYRYQHTRKQKDLQKLLATKNNYAIWDDHDFGPNNSCKVFDLKNISLETYKDYWGNKYYGHDGIGTYSKFQISDGEFFMLDNRYFRDADELPDSLYNKSQLGQVQLDWFLQSILTSKATFKFVVMGGQFLNFNTDQESYQFFKKEREYILNFIQNNKIDGVVFITGDRHHTEVLKFEPLLSDTLNHFEKLTNNSKKKKKEKKEKEEKSTEEEDVISTKKKTVLYEVTCSPLSSKGSNVLKTSEANNPQRIKQTLVVEPNYCQFSVSGGKNNRNLLIKCFDSKNELKWEFTIRQDELKWD